jgi:hypothetical protein
MTIKMKHIKTHFFKNDLFTTPKLDLSAMTPRLGRRKFATKSPKQKDEKVFTVNDSFAQDETLEPDKDKPYVEKKIMDSKKDDLHMSTNSSVSQVPEMDVDKRTNDAMRKLWG